MNGEEFVFFVALLFAIQGSKKVVVQGAESSFTIEQGDFSCGGNLLCSGNATTNGQGLLKLTPDPRPRTESFAFSQRTVGVVLYNQPVQLVHPTTNQVASFSMIGFSFRIESSPSGPSDGMTFVMFGGKDWMGHSGSGLRAYRSTCAGIAGVKILAVEFDTFQNPGLDENDNHVGIDTVSSSSVKAKMLPFRLELERVYRWVDYNCLTYNLAVRAHYTAEKPEQPFISYTTDLRDVFDSEEVWVGFSGSNGGCPCFSYYDSRVRFHRRYNRPPQLRIQLLPEWRARSPLCPLAL